MKYSITFSERARKQLKKLDSKASKTVLSWIEINLNGSENPRDKGKALTGPLKGIWRYRVEDYRILAEIKDEEVIILIIEAVHKKNVYDNINIYN